MKLTGLRRAPTQVDVVVVGRGLPALATALELARRGASVSVVEDAASGERAPELGLVLLGPGRPYLTVANAIGRPAAQLLWAAGCENHLRLKAFLDQAARPCGYAGPRQLPAGARPALTRKTSPRARTCCATTASRASSSTTT